MDRHLVAWIQQGSSRIRHLWTLTDSVVSSLFSGLAYPCNKVFCRGKAEALRDRHHRILPESLHQGGLQIDIAVAVTIVALKDRRAEAALALRTVGGDIGD